jgi:hypothetical protein
MIKVIASLFGVALLALVGLFVFLPRAEPHEPETLAALAPELSVTFPPSTKLIGVLRENGMDDWIAAKVTMNRSDWPSFLASTTLDESRLTPGEGGRFGPNQGFWDPNGHADLRSGQAWLADKFRALNVGVADLQAARVVVYIVNHGT